MAKNNNKQRRNYFENEKTRANGDPDFLEKKNFLQLQNDAVRIFKDLARGSIDVFQYEEYFQNRNFLNAIMKVAQNNVVKSSLVKYYIDTGIARNDFLHGVMPDMVYTVENEFKLEIEAYTIIYSGLLTYSVSNNIADLIPMVSSLAKYRNIL